jgi:hypothetical protein
MRRGAVILELIVATAMLGALLTVCLKLCSVTTAQRRAAEEQQCASLELANVMERVAERPWNQLTTAALATEHISAPAGAQLPGAELKIEVSAPAGQPEAKRLTATLRWPDRDGRTKPLALTMWKYRIGTK